MLLSYKNMSDEQLIELVKKYEIIYDTKSVDYKDSMLRNAAWKQIGKQLGKPAEECKENWTKLRNCYNNALKRRLRKAGKILTPWRYEEQMSFLKEEWKARRSSEHPYLTMTEDNSSESIQYIEEPQSPETMYIPQPSSSTSNSARKNNKNSITCDCMADIVHLLKVSQEIKQEKMGLDDLDKFFLCMSKSVKQLSKVDQIKIKMDLLRSISEAQLKELEDNT